MFLKPIFGIVLAASLVGFGLTDKLQKKVEKVIVSTFEVDVFTIHPKTFSPDVASELPAEFTEDTFYEITTNESLIGYAYVSTAPSKTDAFDYLILFDTDLIIISSKVLVYREDYGGEIGSKRWLKQFNGKTGKDELIYGDNIMAISGATISVKSMTNAVNNVLKSIQLLQQKNQL